MDVPKSFRAERGIEEKTEQLKEEARIVREQEKKPETLKEILEELKGELQKYYKNQLILERRGGRPPTIAPASFIREEHKKSLLDYLPFKDPPKKKIIFYLNESFYVSANGKRQMLIYLASNLFDKTEMLIRKYFEPYAEANDIERLSLEKGTEHMLIDYTDKDLKRLQKSKRGIIFS